MSEVCGNCIKYKKTKTPGIGQCIPTLPHYAQNMYSPWFVKEDDKSAEICALYEPLWITPTVVYE